MYKHSFIHPSLLLLSYSLNKHLRFCFFTEELKRERTMATLFDWKAWNLSCQSGPLAIELWSTIIRRAASNFMDSQLWLLEHNLSWIERADVGIQHVAAQLSVAIKPFAGIYTVTQYIPIDIEAYRVIYIYIHFYIMYPFVLYILNRERKQ